MNNDFTISDAMKMLATPKFKPLSKLNLNPKRGPKESFEKYKHRRALNQAILKSYLEGEGHYSWDSQKLGPHRKEKVA